MAQVPDSTYSSTDISTIRGLGHNYAECFYKKGIYNLFDLLFNFPFKYLDQTKLTRICDIVPDGRYYLIVGRITSTKLVLNSRIRVLNVTIADETGQLPTVFFNPYPNQINTYTNNRRLMAFGKVAYNKYGVASLQHPTVTFLSDEDEVITKDRLTPVYHAVDKVPQTTIRKAVAGVLDRLSNMELEELLPQDLNPFSMTITQALEKVHYPKPPVDAAEKFILEKSAAFKRLCFEELIAYQLTLLSIKKANEKRNAINLSLCPERIEALLKTIPFTLTGAQLRSYKEISEDLNKDTPMMRLLHGDVGSGKTMVAILSAIQTVHSGRQCVLLAPTELLCAQHYNKFSPLLEPFGIKCALLTSSVKGKAREKILKEVADGTVNVLIGTHSVFQDEVTYQSLALAIIDEQHRFGIDQRIALLRKAPKNFTLHQLVMTATPIPRTLQLALFSDLDVSTLDELPKGRVPIVTTVFDDARKNDVIRRLAKVCTEGTQVYWVCPNIEEDEDGENASVIKTHKELKKALPHLEIGLLHGQMATNEKTKVMKNFLEGKIHILVATTIIEVGVDVPNASIIIIEGADRLGLAQLHQLRGRVGRGQKESYCILLHKDCNDNEIALKRLAIMKGSSDGFKIATEDLKLRGPGEVIGQRQTGFDIFRIVDVNRDFELIKDARSAALDIIENRKEVCLALIKRWFPKFNLV